MIDLLLSGPIYTAVTAGILGLLLGSFLNVCSFRWPNDESVVSPRSHCPSCDGMIPWYDNIPVVSYVILRGRCRSCGTTISVQYPLAELATGVIWAGLFWYHGLSGEALRGAVLLTILFGIALTDARYYIIPDEFSLGGLVIGLAAAFLPAGPTAVEAVLGAALGFGLLMGVARAGKLVFKKDAMGGGDIKMMAMIGAFLGIPGVLLTIFLAALLGSVVFGPISWKTGKLVPFGIFLSAGAAITYGWGGDIIGWYVSTILQMPQ
ncbi:MAG: A24 family peptidase [Gemmatimonadota bacterium]|nr:MAG: A24 family peptidase [Gemmatimonadota bacterium]